MPAEIPTIDELDKAPAEQSSRFAGIFDDVPKAAPTINVTGLFDDVPMRPKSAKRLALESEMAAARREGEALEAVTRSLGEMESTAFGLAHPIRQAEIATEATASAIAGQPLQILPQYKPSEIIRQAGERTPKIPMIPEQEGATAQALAGSVNAVSDFINFFTTPEGVATLGIGTLPKTAQRSLLRAFAAQMAVESPQNIARANEAAAEGNIQEAAKLAMTGAGEALFAGTMARHSVQRPVLRERRPDAADQLPEVVIEETAGQAPPTAVPPEQPTIERGVIRPPELPQPEPVKPLPGSSERALLPERETITGPEAEKAAEMPAERGASPRPARTAERPWDIIDEIESQYGRIRGKKSAKPGSEGYYGELYNEALRSGARRIFSNARGSAPDEITDALRRSRWLKPDATVDDLWEALVAASKTRKAFRERRSAESVALEREESQRIDFERQALQAGKEKTSIPVTDLLEGDQLQIAGTKFTVKEMVYDRDTGDLAYVTLEDGRRFGVQTVGAEQVIYPDSGSVKKAEVTPDLPKLRAMERQGDLLANQQEPFNLAGERTLDGDRIAAEREAREATKAEGEEFARKNQMTLDESVRVRRLYALEHGDLLEQQRRYEEAVADSGEGSEAARAAKMERDDTLQRLDEFDRLSKRDAEIRFEDDAKTATAKALRGQPTLTAAQAGAEGQRARRQDIENRIEDRETIPQQAVRDYGLELPPEYQLRGDRYEIAEPPEAGETVAGETAPPGQLPQAEAGEAVPPRREQPAREPTTEEATAQVERLLRHLDRERNRLKKQLANWGVGTDTHRSLSAQLRYIDGQVDMLHTIARSPADIKRAWRDLLELEQRIGSRAERQSIWEMEEGDLADLFGERFGEQQAGRAPLQAGRAGTFTFPTFDAFSQWMKDRYGERDLEGMKLAFAEADTATKIRFIKENRSADQHLRDWIAHLATGSPLPKESPPIPRTTPRPLPGGGTQQPPQPPTPGQPPPPPRQPSFYRKFDLMALTQLFRQFSRFPVVNNRLMSAYGRFVPGTTAIELKERLLWDTALAEKVLGHEVGHFIDLIVPLIGKGKQLAQRLRPLTDFRGQMWRTVELRNDARALSRDWRGPFANGDRYRDTAQELFADFMSAMFNAPEWVNQRYPRLYDAFDELRIAKPSFRSAYREIETWLQGGTMPDEWIGQQREAAKRTIDDLLRDKPQNRRSLGEVFKGSLVTMWHRAFEKEGKPKELGKSITDELEYSSTWAAKENALFADDFNKQVQRQLERVNPDALEARSLLHAYSQARRTIGERRAAGVWIENNPVEARTMLKAILDLDATLRSKFSSALDSATNSQLYDLSAAIFREVHDRGERFVSRMAREIDGLDLGIGGEAALEAFNVRGKLLNPGGLTPENAQRVLNRLRDTLTPEQWTALEQAGANLRDLLFRTQEKAHREGLISRRTWQELIEPNRDNYVPYAVLDYWDGRVRGGVMPQRGTAKDIADTTLAAQLKIAALNAWRQKQRQVKLLMDVYTAGGQPVTVGERLRRASDIDRIRQRAGEDDVSRAVYWRDGQPHLVEFLGDRGKTFEQALESPAFYEHFKWIGDLGRWTHSLMQLYTTFSIPFLVWRNPVRGARTGALRVGFKAIGKQYVTPAEVTQATRMARNYAAAAFGAEMMPEIRDLVDRQVLLPPRLSSAMVRDAANLRELLENGGVLATQVRQLRDANWPWWRGGRFGQQSYEFAERVFTAYEAFEKIVNYRAALSRGATAEQATAIGRRAGIPKPGVGGHLTLPMEVFFPWTRVHIQGVRSTLDVLRDPTYRRGFATRFMLTEGLPRVLKIAVGTGVAAGTIKWLTSKDEDPNDTVMAEVFRRVSPYKMALDDIVPLMLFNPRDGSYHYFNDFKKGSDIPDHYEVVSFRIPASEEGRLWGVLLYNVLSSMPGAKEKMARPGENLITSVGAWAQNYLAPGISPAIETSQALYQMIARGSNPEDPYRGQPAANELLFNAGGTDRAQAIAGYVANQMGGPGEIAAVLAMNLGILDERAADALKKRLASDKTPLPERVPLGRSMFAYDNYAKFREQKNADLAEEQLRAKARLVMSDDVRALYDFYYRNLKHKDDLKGADVRRFELASIFVNDVWGKLDERGSFYSKAAHAVGPDGSNGAKETVRRDLDAAAARLLLRFNQ